MSVIAQQTGDYIFVMSNYNSGGGAAGPPNKHLKHTLLNLKSRCKLECTHKLGTHYKGKSGSIWLTQIHLENGH